MPTYRTQGKRSLNFLSAVLRWLARVMDRGLARIDRYTGGRVTFRARDIARVLTVPGSWRRALLRFRPSVINVSKRAKLRRINWEGIARVEKVYENDAESQEGLAAETLAHQILGDRPWKMPLLNFTKQGYMMPLLPVGARLDLAASRLSDDQKRLYAVEAVSIAFELYMAGVAHRDFHSENIFLYDGHLLLSDYETLGQYPESTFGPFEESYDMVAERMESPFGTDRMCYKSSNSKSLQNVLGVSLEEALDGFRKVLIRETVEACTSFMRTRADFGVPAQRHQLNHGLVYGSIELPILRMSSDQAQRDSTRRFEQFGIGSQGLQGMTVLDLGCNVGAMSFGAHVRGAKQVRGIEFDKGKVEIGNRIARFAGVESTQFRQGNIDELTVDGLGGPSDVVFCFAIEKHVDDTRHLYQLLGDVTSGTLYFEGNAGCEILQVEGYLRAQGFKQVEQLGMSDDESNEANNCRPLIVARR